VSVATPEVLEVVRQLEERRELLRRAAAALSISGINADNFENVGRATGDFYAQVLRLYRRTPFPDLPEALELLQNCMRNLQAETEMTDGASRRSTSDAVLPDWWAKRSQRPSVRLRSLPSPHLSLLSTPKPTPTGRCGRRVRLSRASSESA
jgi:hypothetical protein